MALYRTAGIDLCGIAASVPVNTVSNSAYSAISEAERNLLIKTTGIRERRVAPPGMATSDYCLLAAEKLINDLNWKKEDIGILVFVSQSRDYFLPATAIILQDRLGLPKTCLAFDIVLGCSGYVYGLSVLASMMTTMGIQKALLLAGDISTHTMSPEDKSTYPLFGDAGTASALALNPNSSPWFFNLQSDGSGYEAIIIPDGGMRQPENEKTFTKTEVEKGIIRHRRNLWLNGIDVFNFSIREVPLNIKALAEFAGKDLAAIDYFVMHQANLLMNETIRKKLKIPPEKTPYSLNSFGNTSSASIPLTMVTQIAGDLASGKRNLLLSGFGVGLSWGSVFLDTKNLVCPNLIEA